jgi:hypothetical protein
LDTKYQNLGRQILEPWNLGSQNSAQLNLGSLILEPWIPKTEPWTSIFRTLDPKSRNLGHQISEPLIQILSLIEPRTPDLRTLDFKFWNLGRQILEPWTSNFGTWDPRTELFGTLDSNYENPRSQVSEPWTPDIRILTPQISAFGTLDPICQPLGAHVLILNMILVSHPLDFDLSFKTLPLRVPMLKEGVLAGTASKIVNLRAQSFAFGTLDLKPWTPGLSKSQPPEPWIILYES